MRPRQHRQRQRRRRRHAHPAPPTASRPASARRRGPRRSSPARRASPWPPCPAPPATPLSGSPPASRRAAACRGAAPAPPSPRRPRAARRSAPRARATPRRRGEHRRQQQERHHRPRDELGRHPRRHAVEHHREGRRVQRIDQQVLRLEEEGHIVDGERLVQERQGDQRRQHQRRCCAAKQGPRVHRVVIYSMARARQGPLRRSGRIPGRLRGGAHAEDRRSRLSPITPIIAAPDGRVGPAAYDRNRRWAGGSVWLPTVSAFGDAEEAYHVTPLPAPGHCGL